MMIISLSWRHKHLVLNCFISSVLTVNLDLLWFADMKGLNIHMEFLKDAGLDQCCPNIQESHCETQAMFGNLCCTFEGPWPAVLKAI